MLNGHDIAHVTMLRLLTVLIQLGGDQMDDIDIMEVSLTHTP